MFGNLCYSPLVTEADLSPEIQKASKTTIPVAGSLPPGASLKAAVEELERHMLQEALIASAYNQVRAARGLGLSRQEFIKKLKRYGIPTRAGTL